MSFYRVRSAYFKMICGVCKLFSHGRVDPASGDVRNTFFRLNNEAEALAAQVNSMHFPALVHLDYAVKPFLKDDDERLAISNAFWVLSRPADASADALEDAFSEAEEGLIQLIAYMLNQYEESGSCGPFKLIDISMFSWQQTGPEMDGLYGYELHMREEQRPTALLNFNPENYY